MSRIIVVVSAIRCTPALAAGVLTRNARDLTACADAIGRRPGMPRYSSFLAFVIDAENGETASRLAQEMVDGNTPFPDDVIAMGVEYTPNHFEELGVALKVVIECLPEARILTDAENWNN